MVAGIKHAHNAAEMYEVISGATDFILLAGWSVVTEIILLRGQQDEIKLGEILVKEGKKGILLVAMVWDHVCKWVIRNRITVQRDWGSPLIG